MLRKGKYRFWCHLYFCRRRYRLGLMAKKCLNRKQMTLYYVGVWSPLGVQESLRHAQIYSPSGVWESGESPPGGRIPVTSNCRHLVDYTTSCVTASCKRILNEIMWAQLIFFLLENYFNALSYRSSDLRLLYPGYPNLGWVFQGPTLT